MSLFDAFKRKKEVRVVPGFYGGGNNAGNYHNLFPKCQLFKPKYEYPLWDKDWDMHGRTRSNMKKSVSGKTKQVKQVTRHIFLVRHGQYREDLQSDRNRVLTKKGREQATKTGQWLAEIIRKNNISTSTCKVKLLSCSTMARAKETANIIYEEIEEMYSEHNSSQDLDGSSSENTQWVPILRDEPDPMLIEGIPCHFIPTMGQKVSQQRIDQIHDDHPRMEGAFRKYIARSEWLEELNESNAFVMNNNNYKSNTTAIDNNDCDDTNNNDSLNTNTNTITNTNTPPPLIVEREHEYQIIVSHSNMIRYLTCRALQIPPESWLRLSLFNGSVTYLVIHAGGEVSLRLFGEIGHMGYDLVSADLYEGFNWDSLEFYKTAQKKEGTKNKNEKEEEEEVHDNNTKYSVPCAEFTGLSTSTTMDASS